MSSSNGDRSQTTSSGVVVSGVFPRTNGGPSVRLYYQSGGATTRRSGAEKVARETADKLRRTWLAGNPDPRVEEAL